LNTRFDPELSRLAFEDRLIEFCEDGQIPVLERVRLLAIVAGRLDVFFMTRVGRLKRLAVSGDAHQTSAPSPAEQLDAIAVEAHRIIRRADRLLADDLLPTLATSDVRIERWESLEDQDREFLRRTCGNRVGALISPVVVEPTAAFPHVRNLRPALAADARRYESGTPCSVVIELPAELPRLVPLRTGHRFVPLEQIVAAELPALFPEMEATDVHLFRVTRNADTDFGGEYDVLGSIEREVVGRPFQEVVRLEVEHSMPARMRQHLLGEFLCEDDTPAQSLGDQDVYVVSGLMDLTALEELAGLDLPRLKRAPITPRPTRADHLLGAARSGDVLLHFPFDDYETSLERLLTEAARHPDLESIQATIYRTDRNSDVVASLRAARAKGAEVNAIVELKASFDERDNIELARSLGEAGVHVVLSPSTLKVHAKIALVTLRGSPGPHRVALVGTGNMNAVTARSYVDLWLLTAQPACTREVAAVFDMLMGRPQDVEFSRLLVAPFDMRQRFLELIDRETAHARAGKASGIRVMINGLSDPAIIAALYRASQADVAIDMIVRGICALRPGQAGLSENIRIVSVVGHLLQHARIFHFRNAGNDAYFIGSADWRPRNLDGRIEVVTSIQESDHMTLLDRILTDTLAAREAWELGADGVYVRVARGPASPPERPAFRT
jgi:polyphosphate kinase